MRGPTALLVLAACGRVGFDGVPPPPDAPAADAAPSISYGDDCVVGFAMDEASWISAPVIDACGGDHHGTALGIARPVDDPVRGRVGQFGNLTDCVVVPDGPALDLGTAVTLSAWVFPTGLDAITPRGIIAKRTDDTLDVAYTMFTWTADKVVVDIDGENDEVIAGTVIANDRWQQLTAVYDGSRPAAQRIAIYIDGRLDQTLGESSAAIPNYPSPLHVGCLPIQPPGSNQQSFAGRLDDVGIWSRAWSATEVEAWFEATRR